jgi:hypothetical protein
MALGGGNFLTQNKVLPGAYINFVSATRASANLSDRGIATMPFLLDWGVQKEVMAVTAGDLQKNSLKLFGYDYTAPQLRGLRDLFKNIRLAYIFRLGSGGVKASNNLATAKYAGTRGNDLKIVIGENPDDASKMDVSVFLGTVLVANQTVSAATDLVGNDFVTWKADMVLTPTAGTPLAGGTSPTPTNADYQAYLDSIESYSFNALGCPSNESEVKGLFTAFTRRLRDEQGVKFQCVAYDNAADYEGVVNVMNSVSGPGADKWNTVYWVTGVIAGTAVNASALNRVYNGEYTIDVNYTQLQLEEAIQTGKFAFHRVGSDIRVLSDINSLVNITVDKGEVFKENQTIRVIDQIANDIAVLFNTKYLGVVPNDAAGRISLWADIVKHHEQLQDIRAIEGFSDDDVNVAQGETKRSVVVNDVVTVVNAMAQLYMILTVT